MNNYKCLLEESYIEMQKHQKNIVELEQQLTSQKRDNINLKERIQQLENSISSKELKSLNTKCE